MKKILVILMAALFVLPMTGVSTIEAQSVYAKQLEKMRKKEFKLKMKELSQEGWKVYGMSKPIETALLEHYEELFQKGDAVYELVGIAYNFKSPNAGKVTARNSAAAAYAESAKSYMEGRLVSEVGTDAINEDREFDNLYGAYQRLVASEINGQLKESFTVIRDLGNGKKEMQVFFIVDQEAATKARLRAMELAFQETQMAQTHAE